MPRQQSLQIEQNSPFQVADPQVTTSVVSHPVDPYADMGAELHQQRLDNLLKAGTDLFGAIDQEEQNRGAQDAALGKQKESTWLGSYEHGYMTLQGAMQATQDTEAIKAQAEADGALEKPPADYLAWKQQQLADKTKDLPDGPLKRAYMANMAKTTMELDQQYAATQSRVVNDNLRANATGLLRTRLADMAVPGKAPDPAYLDQAYEELQKQHAGVSRPEFYKAVQGAFSDYIEQGRPEVFDILKKTKMYDTPELAQWTDQAHRAAQRMKDHLDNQQKQAVQQSLQPTLFLNRQSMEQAVLDGKHVFTPEEISGSIGEFKQFKTAEEAHGFMSWQREQLQKGRDVQLAVASFGDGQMWLRPAEVQKKALDKIVGGTGGIREQYAKAVATGDSQAAANAAKLWTTAYHKSGASVTDDILANQFKSVINSVDDGTNPQLRASRVAAAEFYRALPPQLQQLYAEGDTKKWLDRYTFLRASNDEQAALLKTNDYFTPQAQARREALSKDPDLRKKLKEAATDERPGAWRSALPQGLLGWLGADQHPDNDSDMEMAAQAIGHQAIEAGEVSSVDELRKYVADKMANSFVFYSKTDNILRGHSQAVQVPEGQANAATQSWVTNTLEQAEKSNPGHTFKLQFDGKSGYTLWDTTGATSMAAAKPITRMSLDDMHKQYVAQKVMTAEDGKALTELRKKVAAGTLTFEEVQKAQPLMDKMRINGFVDERSDPIFQAAGRLARQDFLNRVSKMPQVALGPAATVYRPSDLNIPDTGPTARGVSKWIGGSANSMYEPGVALTIAREGIRLNAYPDPNPQAGMNIAGGYNFSAQAKNLVADFKEAGIPVDRIEDIKAGKQGISEAQAISLTTIAHKRAEAETRNALNKVAPNVWLNMTPEQRGVMTDIAYQVGGAGVGKFQKAIAALVKGDQQAFQNEAQVSYTNKNGQFVKDTRGNDLRAALLAGPDYFRTLLTTGFKANR